MRWKLIALVGVATIALAACGSSGTGTGSGGGSSSASGGMGGMSMSPSASGSTTFAFGEPGKASQVDKTVGISMLDTLKFDPASVSVKMGQTVKFEITNTGAITHEFVLGDQATQDEEEAAMASGSMMNAPNVVQIEAGQSATVVWKVTTMGTLIYGCHQPGHYAGGMRGTVDVAM